MGQVDLLWITAALLSSPLLTLCQPLNILSAPNILRVGNSENVFVEAQDYAGGPLNVRIVVKNHPQKNRELASESVVLSAASNYQALAAIKIPENKEVFNSGPLGKQYVYLQAHFPSGVLEKEVLVSFQSGYIFIQTDKSIYTPNSTVRCRVFSVTPDLQPLDQNEISVEIIVSGHIATLKNKNKKKSPTARYKYAPQKNFTAEFEVKEYVLPTFEVTLNPSKSFFYIDDDRLQVDITAKYLFGNKVEGSAFVVFGVMQGDSRTSLPASLRRENIRDGAGRATLTKEMIQKTFPDIKQLIGNSLYISVSVLTETGSEMVEAQRRGIYIVTSPYTIYFKRTPKFFKPGMPFDVMVYVTNPDQTPAENVDVVVSPGGGQSRTKVNGMAKVTVNTHAGAKTLEIKVKTNDPGIPNNRQDEKQMTALVYTTKGGSSNYLHIGIDVEELKVGDNMKVSLHFVRSDGVKNQDFTYLILSKGLIVQANRFKRQGHSLVTLSVPVTKDMLPSFRVVAYYHVGSSEVVADSVWVDVKDTCMGKLRVEVKEPKKSYEPGERFGLKITGDSAATVGLVAVDKGVFVLNKNRLTQEKIWDIIEKEDTGCTAGSGKDSMGVFYDAGLLFQSDKAGGTGSRTTTDCPTSPKRKRRAATIFEVTQTLIGNYRGDQKKCCADGLRPNKLGYTCERRATFIIDGQECIQAFLTCCKEIQKVKNKNVEEQMLLARSMNSFCYTSADEITSRTQFPESWLWEDRVAITTLNMDNIQLKDSITTWQILAISLSQTHGICVADPYEMVVKKDFFLDLKLPYSAVRNEQLEIKAVLHNFSNKNQKVRVDFIGTENVCSAASKKGRYRTIVNVGAQSSRSVSYIIVPMELGNHSIEVKAAVYESTLTDGVRKTLKVVVSVSQELSITVQQAISGDFMGRLIVQPGGCGEQNMVYMTLPLIATYYLDTTKQWERVGIHRRAEAIRHIQKGYQNELAYRKADGSYAAWISRASSTWLTAYVAKVFAMASGLVPIQENVVCSALQWLVLNAQMPDGIFIEKAPVSHGGMVGDVRGKDADASLTAFVLIAMQEGNELCAKSVPSLAQSMWKAIQYLERRIPSLTNPYAVAMTSYAMANAGKFDKALLMRYSSGDGAYWEVTSGHHFSLEATAYALLALVKAKQLEEAGKAVNWLNRQTSPYGSSGTTQATIMVFQSVAEYYKRASGYQSGELDVEVSVRGRPDSIRWIFKRETSHLTYSEKVNLNQEFTVTAKGHGVGSLKVITLYYASPTEKESDCRDFDLTIKMERQREGKIHCDPKVYKSPTRDATMSILDIGLLTGFVVDEKDLSDLITGSDRYIQKFEMDKQLSERGSLILYLDKVHMKTNRIAFGVHKISEVAMLQPAGITVYEYYSPEKRCTKFYHPTKKDGALNKLCNEQEGVCECAEENCSIQKKQKIEEKDREKVACQSNIDYVYRVKVMKTDRSPYTDHHTMTIEQVLKGTTNGDYLEQGQVRSFRGHTNCRESYGFVEGKVYLIMGQSRDLPKTDGRLQYVLDDQTWIEYWPTYEEGQTPEYRDKYVGITGLAQNLVKFGC
uniref:Anaphylatoxin-like domain-containing protein n=1 Tax=Pygocentrus nattereri TaxID=42514 RepID=A0AAR2J2I4_PYGNA